MQTGCQGKGQKFHIEKLIYGGDGLARLNGRAVFIPYVLPGEEVVAVIEEDRGDYLRGRLLEVLQPGSSRREKSCGFYPQCGGCQLQHMEYAAQLPSKVEILMEMMRRQLKGTDLPEPGLFFSPEWGYRRNVRFHISWSPARCMGFFRPRSREVVDLPECPLLHSPLKAAFSRLRSLPSPLDSCFKGQAIAWKAVSSWNENRVVSVLLAPRRSRSEEPRVLSYLVDEGQGSRELQREEVPTVLDQLGRWRYNLHPLAFFQSNGYLVPELLQVVEKHCRASSGRGLAVDLYAGPGLFTLPLASYFCRTVAVEQDPFSDRLAEENAHLNQADSIERFLCPVEDWLLKQWPSGDKIDLLLVDPPREGLSRKVSEWVLSRKPDRIVYVSCSPPTLVRDLKRWIERSEYRITQLDCLDMFPQTYHLETVAVLDGQNR